MRGVSRQWQVKVCLCHSLARVCSCTSRCPRLCRTWRAPDKALQTIQLSAAVTAKWGGEERCWDLLLDQAEAQHSHSSILYISGILLPQPVHTAAALLTFPISVCSTPALDSIRQGGLPPTQKRFHLGWDLVAKLLSPGDRTEQVPTLPSPPFLKVFFPPSTSLWAKQEALQPPASSAAES